MKKKINVSISEELLKTLNEYSEKNHMKKSNVIEKALLELFKRDNSSL